MDKSEPNGLSLEEQIRQIPDFKFDPEILNLAVRDRGKTDFLGFSYLEIEPTADFNSWHQAHQWVPLKNAKQVENFAEAIFSNDKSRHFIDGLDASTGEHMMKYINAVEASCHISRLLSTPNSSVLTDFSLAWMKYLKDDTQVHLHNIEESVSHSRDGNAGTQFWTIAPYLFDELKNSGVEELKAFESVLLWSKARQDVTSPAMDAKYPGIQDPYTFGNGNFWYLTKFVEGPSHILAREVGKHLAKQLSQLT